MKTCWSHRHRGLAWAGALAVALVLAQGQAALAQNGHILPLVVSASTPSLQGFVRIINNSERAGTVRIHAIDDTGKRFGPVELSLEANAARQFNSSDLEESNAGAGLSAGVGSGQGHWWLELETELDIEPLAYVRTSDGFLTSAHDVAEGRSMTWRVPIFNPASNRSLRSLLRVVNTSGIDTEVVITGMDARGVPAPQGEVRFMLPADAARTLSAQALEEGDSQLDGRLGDGAGKWQLSVSAGRPIAVVSLMSTRSGHLSNLSSTAGTRPIRGSAGSDDLYGGMRDDVIDPGDNGGPGDRGWDTVHGSAGDDRIVYTGSGPTAYQELSYSELDTGGIRVTIDGAANRATVDKGSVGSDTIVDVAHPLHAGWLPTSGGFGIQGTQSDDVFDVDLDDEQWMAIGGEGGDDTINIGPGGLVAIAYWYAPAGVDVDLAAGRARNDGHGDVDTINGDAWGVIGSGYADVIRGSDNDETFDASAGDDVIDGRGGFDHLRFTYTSSVIRDLNVDLAEGTASGTRGDSAFAYTLSNIERVTGSRGDDVLRGSDGSERLGGGGGNDVLDPRDNDDGWDRVTGSAGDDRIVYTGSGPTAYQELSYHALDTGIRATIDGAANHATVDKGAAGTDTIVDIANPLVWGVGLYGTSSDDVFNLTLGDAQWMLVAGGAGNDTFNISRGSVLDRLDYWVYGHHQGIDVDLRTGRVRNDGFGTVDTITGIVWEVHGTSFDDVIRGSGNGESFIGLWGDDLIDGRGGFDRLRFDRSGIGDVSVDLEEGTATGTWSGRTFSYTVRNIEHVRGGAGNDTFRGSSANERFEGRSGKDTFIFEAGHGEDSISDFTDGQDTIVLRGLGVSKSQVLDAASGYRDGDDFGVWIDLSEYGGGTISLWNFDIADLDASDFLL